MNKPATKTSSTPSSALSVSYRSSELTGDENAQPEAIILTDPRFIIIGMNKAAEFLYGTTSKKANGRPLFNLIALDVVDTSQDEILKKIIEQGFWKGDISYRHNKKELMLSTRCSLVNDNTGEPSSIVVTVYNNPDTTKERPEVEEYKTLIESLSEGTMLINANGTITAVNKKAAHIFGYTEDVMNGKAIYSPEWKIIREDGSEFPHTEYPAILTLKDGSENTNVIMGLQHREGKKIWVSITSRPIFENHSRLPMAAVVSVVETTEAKKVNEQLIQSELLFRTFMKNSPTLGWIYDEDGVLIYGNPRFLDVVGLPEGTTKKNITNFVDSDNLRTLIINRNKEVLLNKRPLITEDEFAGKDGNVRSYLSYWFLLPATNDKKMIGGHAVEITENKKARKEIDKIFERYTFAINASSDAIWDMDVAADTIYRSDAFSAFTGYLKEDIDSTLEWFIEKIHPSDRQRVRINIDYCLKNNVTDWENEYRFQIADGSYRHLLDKAYAIYEDGKLTRVIGSMQDMTERKKLEAQLLNEQVQKQKMVNQAIIQAQEKERNRISGELHDNVNQLLTSAKLHICVAKTRAEGDTPLLDKANQYLLMAVEEIRALSKTLNSTVITNIGLLQSIEEIGSTMRLLKNIQLHTCIEEEVVSKMNADQQMMVYRIIQEQSNNILKHADTDKAIISLKIADDNFELIISDNGKGFDKSEQKANGIGFINIFNRVDAYNGKVEIIASPGHGCTLLINFPVIKESLN